MNKLCNIWMCDEKKDRFTEIDRYSDSLPEISSFKLMELMFLNGNQVFERDKWAAANRISSVNMKWLIFKIPAGHLFGS